MTDSGTELERWLAGGELLVSAVGVENWEPGFEVDRQVVCSRIGNLYQKVFLRPDDFVKRFYHEVYPLPIDNWHYQEQIALYDNFCHIDVDLELRFQATLTYIQRNIEYIENINQHIKQTFQNTLTDIVHQKINNLNDGIWVQNGLSDVEKNITVAINEQLIVQNVQSQTICKLNANFADFPDVQPGRDHVYLHTLKKSYEMTKEKSIALFQQQQTLEKQKLLQKHEQLEQLNQQAELERQQRALEAENKLILLKDKEKQLAEQLAIEKRIYAQRVKHKNQLKEMDMDAELLTQQKQKAKQRVAESQNLTDALAHQAQLEEKKAQADLQRREKQQIIQTQAHQNKTQAEIERYEKQQKIWREAKLRIHEQQLVLKQRQKQLEAEAEEEFKQRQKEENERYLMLPFRKLEKSEEVDKSRKKSEALRNEIELAVLEKQRLDLELAIKEAQQNYIRDED